jgi:hypothetical protein
MWASWLFIPYMCTYTCYLLYMYIYAGGLTSDQLAALEAGGGGGGPTTSANASGGGVGNGDTGSGSTSSSASAHVVPESLNSQPCCPWFVCCY